MARGVATTGSLDAAALAIAVGVMTNTALKLGLALFFGTTRFRTIVGATLALMLVTTAALVFPLLPGRSGLRRVSNEIVVRRGQFLVVLPQFNMIGVINSWNVFGQRVQGVLGPMISAMIASAR